MKKITTFLFIAGILANVVFGQATLTYEKHALKSGYDNPMSYCSYLEPGLTGSNVLWDFRSLEFKRSFTGYLTNSNESELGKIYTMANTDLDEFGAHFYFNVSQSKIEHYGYSSSNGRVQTKYSIPYVKMKYPFSYTDNYTGSFSGITLNSGVEVGEINGSYSVEADAYGTLLLPGGSQFLNTVRVRSIKNYTSTYSNSEQEVEVITYRWYNEVHRYPLLVLTEYSVKTGENISTNFQAAFNNNAVNIISPISITSLTLFPNPASSQLIIEYEGISTGELSFSIIDANGRLVRSFQQEITNSGLQQFDFSKQIEGLRPASYVLRIQNGEESINRSFSLIE